MLEKTRLEMSNEELLPLKTILVNLKDFANKIRESASFCVDVEIQLVDYGYDWFEDISRTCNVEQFKEHVMKVFAIAVNEAIEKKVDLKRGKKVVNTELHQLLNIDKRKSLDHYFIPVSDRQFASMSSPLDMAKYLKKTAPQWLVKNIIQHQFDIRWNRRNGHPADYAFYQFYNNENTTEFFKYKPRQAHVKATLYKECRRKSVNYLRGITKENLCPTVYMRTADGWISWQADEDKFYPVRDINKTLSWINSSIRTFITENADEQNVNSLRKSLEKPTLYWAVLKDSDFKSDGRMKLKEIGRTQVYVGKANNGIQGRWLKDSDNHCEMMKKCLDNVCAMTRYDPLRLERISLVDARLTLAKVRGEETALFVIKTFGDDVEKAEIAQEKAEASLREAKRSLNRAITNFTGRITRANSRREVAKRQEELDQAIAVTEDSKNLTKSQAESRLSTAEKWHRNGKVNRHKNIILYEDYDMTWTPKNMGYGMNFS